MNISRYILLLPAVAYVYALGCLRIWLGRPFCGGDNASIDTRTRVRVTCMQKSMTAARPRARTYAEASIIDDVDLTRVCGQCPPPSPHVRFPIDIRPLPYMPVHTFPLIGVNHGEWGCIPQKIY